MWDGRRRGRRRARRSERVPLLLPPSERPGGGSRTATRLIWVAMVLAAIAVGVILVDPPFLARWLADSTDGAVSTSEGVAEVGAPLGDGRLSTAADSVSHALRVYRQRHTDFEGGRISCAGLTAGYARLGQHLVALARARADLERATPEEDAVFETAIERAAEADRLFAAAGCPRP